MNVMRKVTPAISYYHGTGMMIMLKGEDFSVKL